MSREGCTVTVTERKHPCRFERGHEGMHKGSTTDWVWWHGNGEECPADCPKCAQIQAAS